MNPTTKSLKVYIKSQTGETSSKTILLYIPVFKMGSQEALLRLLKFLQKTIKGEILKTGPQMYTMMKNLLTIESLRVLDHHVKANGNETKENYKMVMEGLTTQSFPTQGPPIPNEIPPPGLAQALG